jgi:hypothetical protein
MSVSRVILISLLGLPLAGYAQGSDPAPAPHFYGGLGLYSSSHHNLSGWSNGARIPVQAVIGYQWRPRLAVQLGLAYSGNRSQYNYDYFYSPNYPAPSGARTDVAGSLYPDTEACSPLSGRFNWRSKA